MKVGGVLLETPGIVADYIDYIVLISPDSNYTILGLKFHQVGPRKDVCITQIMQY